MVFRSKNLMGFLCLCSIGMTASGQSIPLQDLSSFHDPGKSWSITGDAIAHLDKPDVLEAGSGTGVLLNVPDKKHPGQDLFSNAEFGDIDLELDYMIAPGANSGVYLQGRYEIQLLDSWNVLTPKSSDNGGIYERWDDKRGAGKEGYDGHAPRYNVSKAPGLWQHLKVSFMAPRFDAAGHKTANARMLLIELNGVTIHEDVELLGATRGAASEEKATGPLRLQGDHGAVAFRNITIAPLGKAKEPGRRDDTDPILVDAPVNTILRSFMDVPGTRIVHAVSVGSPESVHYTYDMDRGMLVQVWRGGFLDATSMWHDRGNGCSRPRGTVQYLGKPAFTLFKQAATADTTGTGYHPKGYVLDDKDRPTFKYILYGAAVTDAVRVLSEGHGVHRELTVSAPVDGLFARLAQGRTIETLSKDMYIIDGKSYYLQLEDVDGQTPVIRDADGLKELIIPVRSKLSYSILF
jgi:hypothetical protein